MKVLKFGGTSVGTVESLRNVKQIVESIDGPVVVVVSALGGLTDRLISTAHMAEKADQSYTSELLAMKSRHYDIVNTLVPENEREDLKSSLDELFGRLENVYKGISLLEELSPRSLDKVVSFGEMLSSRIIARIIDNATLFDSTEFIKTVNRFGRHLLDSDRSNRLISHTFGNCDFKVAVVPGFIASDSDGITTNLGRGGSDYTAAILAANLGADVLEIWTDVDGFMTADPRIVSGTKVIPDLSFTEAMELCNFGAKVIYPPTIYPVFHKNIPIYIKNTFNPSARGTCIYDIKDRKSQDNAIKGVSSINDSCLLTVKNDRKIKNLASRLLNNLTRNGISVLLVSHANTPDSITFSLPQSDIERAMEALSKEFEAELETGEFHSPVVEMNLATIAVVADNMKSFAGLTDRLHRLLNENKIDVLAYSQGQPETSVAFVVPMDKRTLSLQTIHDEIFAMIPTVV